MSDYTQGPWKISRDGERYYVNVPPHEPSVRLIAAAPELLEALRWYAEQAEDLNKGGWTAGKALGQLRADRGKRAKEAIAKAKGERTVRSSPQEPDSFTVEAARAAIAKAKGE